MGVAGIPLNDYRDIALEAEAAGAYAICVGEATYESFATAALFGAITTRPKIISAITTWVRPPINTALASATVDEITSGRFELGLGTMPDQWNRDHYGINADRPVSRMREYVAAIRSGWQASEGRTAEFSGEYYQITGYKRLSKPFRTSLPIHLAVTRPGMAMLAGEIADGVIVNWMHTKEWLFNVLEPAIETGNQISGNRSQRCAMVRVLIEPNAEKARELLRPSFNLYRQVPYFHEITASAGFTTTPTSEISDELIDSMTIHGSMEHVVELLNSRYGTWADWLEIVPPSGIDSFVIRESYENLIKLITKLNN